MSHLLANNINKFSEHQYAYNKQEPANKNGELWYNEKHIRA